MEHFVMREERYRDVIREEKYEYYMAPPQEKPLKIMLERFGKRAEQKAFADSQRQNYHQQAGGHIAHKPQTTMPHHEGHFQQPVFHKAPYPFGPGHFEQPNMRNQIPPLMKHGGVEAAKQFGGVVFIDYGKNKSPLRA